MRMTVLVVAATVVIVIVLMTGLARLVILVSVSFVGDRQMAHGGHGSCEVTERS